ncbi:MAG: hypothetical protein LDLANPLL_02201 [Turneriella sp.]|nr:hypothetical protein [Turneriella sp.]
MSRVVHALLYRAEEPDSRVDRWNIKLIQRVVEKSTTPVVAEIYYHQSTQPSSWVTPNENIRFYRLRSGEAIPLAERIQRVDAEYVLVFDGLMYLCASDIWLLMGLVKAHNTVALTPARFGPLPNENFFIRSVRQAYFALYTYLGRPTPSLGVAFALDKLTQEKQSNFIQKVEYADFVRAIYKNTPQQIRGQSRTTAHETRRSYLQCALLTVEAFKVWNRNKIFPYWFSYRFLLFLVAQLAVYIGVLTLYIAPFSSLPLFLFAILITPQFFFSHLSWRFPHRALVQVLTRLLLYLVG